MSGSFMFNLAATMVLALGGVTFADGPNYVGSAACAECHEEQYSAWLESDHRHAMHSATPEFVRGAFDGSSLNHFGLESRFTRDEGDRFIIETDDAQGRMRSFEVAYTFGWRPLQQYLIRFPDGRYQVSHLSWDTERNEWFHHYPEDEMPPGDPLHWTGPLFTWNRMCAECHTVDLRKNFDLETDTYDTQWNEVGVGCESCHGAGGAHVERAADLGGGDAESSGVLNLLSSADPGRMLNTCAPCHSRRSPITQSWKPGEVFLDHYAPELLVEPLYFPDGQTFDEVFVYGSFMQSRMAAEGVTCNDCHEPHSLELRRPGNSTCTSCHEAPTYDTEEHHHHQAGRPGGDCVDCHMPSRNYMVVDPRRDHRFGSPRPDLTETTGAPNACNDCHADQSNDWSLKHWREWYGDEPRDSFALTFSQARDTHPDAAGDLAAILKDPEQAPMVRATAAIYLGNYADNAGIQARLGALGDAEALVRAMSARSLAPLAVRADVHARLMSLLDDPVRLVRIEAVRPMVRMNRASWSEAQKSRFLEVLDEEFEAENANADHPASHLNRGSMLTDLGRMGEAEEAYRIALRLDPTFTPARHNLALLLYDRQRIEEAEAEFREILKHDPENVEAHYSLGLLLAEMPGRRPEALESLEKAAALGPLLPDIHYNLGLLHLEFGHFAEARAALRKAEALAPEVPAYVYALLTLSIQERQWDKALRWIERLQELDPESEQWRELEQALRERAGGGG